MTERERKRKESGKCSDAKVVFRGCDALVVAEQQSSKCGSRSFISVIASHAQRNRLLETSPGSLLIGYNRIVVETPVMLILKNVKRRTAYNVMCVINVFYFYCLIKPLHRSDLELVFLYEASKSEKAMAQMMLPLDVS